MIEIKTPKEKDMNECGFCNQYIKICPILGTDRFMGGRLRIVDLTQLGTGVSWRPNGEIDLDFLRLNYCPSCGRKLNDT